METQQNYYETSENFNTEEKDVGEHALNLKFTLGYSAYMIGAVHNLTLGDKKEIFFPAAHTGVIYNYETHEQKLLQGHCNLITACCVAYDQEMKKRWIVTADSGKNSMIVIWNADTGTPYRNIFKIPPYQIVSIDISKNCYFIATLSNEKEGDTITHQYIIIWEWKYKTEQILLSKINTIEVGEEFKLLRFNPNSEGYDIELLISGSSKILFWNINPTNPDACRSYFPHKSKGEKSEGNQIGTSKKNTVLYTQSTFLKDSSMVITATTGGYVIVWDVCEALCKENENKNDRRKIKTVQLLKYKKDVMSDKDIINFLVNYENYIVIGSGDGAIKFYDYKFIIVRWFENVCWLVFSISFDMDDSSFNSRDNSFIIHDDKKDDQESGNTNKFKCIPFITSDISASIIRVSNVKNAIIDYNDENIKYQEIYKGVESNITSIALHPKQQLLVLGTNGKSDVKKHIKEKQKESIIREKKFEFKPYVQLFYYPDHMKAIKEQARKKREEEEINKTKKQEDIKNKTKDDDNYKVKSEEDEKRENPFKRELTAAPTVLEYSPDGKYLMIGTSDEKILVLHPENLSINLGPVLQIKDITDQEGKAHITEIIFSPDDKHFAATDSIGRIGLFKNENPFSKDISEKKVWTLVARHYFPKNKVISFCFNEKGNKLYTVNEDRILHEFNVDTNSLYDKMMLPESTRKLKLEYDCNVTSLLWYPLSGPKEKNLLIANDAFKMRQVMTSEFLIKQTCLGPTYGSPIKKLKVIPGNGNEKRMLAFSTGHKIFGLIYLPLDGNPFKIMGVVGHPNNIQDMKPAKNLDYILTTGGGDLTINGWKYNINPLIDSWNNGGDGIDPFLTLLEGGREGLLFQDMINFFYYAQIKSKDENTTKHRTLSEKVQTKFIHGLLAAMGYYPSKTELENIHNEVKYSRINETDKPEDSINFDMFVKLYINHRPYKDLEIVKIESTFESLKAKYKQLESPGKDDNHKGIPRDVFFDLMKKGEDGIDDKEMAEILQVLRGDPNSKNLPDNINFEYLFSEILKFEELKPEEENK